MVVIDGVCIKRRVWFVFQKGLDVLVHEQYLDQRQRHLVSLRPLLSFSIKKRQVYTSEESQLYGYSKSIPFLKTSPYLKLEYTYGTEWVKKRRYE